MENLDNHPESPFGGVRLVEHFGIRKENLSSTDTMEKLNYIWRRASKLAELKNTTPMQEIAEAEQRTSRGVGSDRVIAVHRYFKILTNIDDSFAELNAL